MWCSWIYVMAQGPWINYYNYPPIQCISHKNPNFFWFLHCMMYNVVMHGFMLLLHTFIWTCYYSFTATWFPYTTSIYLSISSNKPGIKSGTYGIIWHISTESKIQLVYCNLLPKYIIELLSLPDIFSIYAYIFCF